jgi:hypothetical protein
MRTPRGPQSVPFGAGALHELAQLGGATMGEGYGMSSIW